MVLSTEVCLETDKNELPDVQMVEELIGPEAMKP